MSIDNSFERIAAALESIASSLANGVSATALATADAAPAATKPAKATPAKTETKAAVERPTVSGDDTGSTTSSSADAASASQPEPPTEDAPAAEPSSPSQPELTEVNAAVLAFNRKNGREKTVALLQKYGGSKVPEIDVSKHADLLAELQAGL